MTSFAVVEDSTMAPIPKIEISGGNSSVSTGVDSIKLAMKPVRGSTHQHHQQPTKKFWKRLASMIVQTTTNNKDGQSKKTNKSKNGRRPTKNKQPQPYARGVFIKVPPMPVVVVVVPDTTTTITTADPGLDPVASFADRSDKTIDTAASNLSLGSTAVPPPPAQPPAVYTTTNDDDDDTSSDDTAAHQQPPTVVPPTLLPPNTMELGRWTASNCHGHDTDMPVLVRKPEYESFGEDDDDKKLLSKVLVQARTLPVNSGKYASNHVMINGERLKRRCPPLSRNVTLDALARQHATLMASWNKLVHPEDPTDVWKELWLSTTSSSLSLQADSNVKRLGSNLGRGRDLADIHKYMMLSAAERNNLLDKRYTTMGVGTARATNGTIFLCQLFSG